MNWSALLVEVAKGLTPLFIAVLTFLTGKLVTYVDAKMKNETTKHLLERFAQSVTDIVKEVAQTYADALRAPDGKLDPASAAAAKQKAIDAVKAYWGPKGIETLKKILGIGSDSAMDAAIATQVEATVHDTKPLGLHAYRMGAANTIEPSKMEMPAGSAE